MTEEDQQRELTRFKAIPNAEKADSSKKRGADDERLSSEASIEEHDESQSVESHSDSRSESRSMAVQAVKKETKKKSSKRKEEEEEEDSSEDDDEKEEKVAKRQPAAAAAAGKQHKPNPFAKQLRELEARRQAELEQEQALKERKKKLREDRNRRFAKKAKRMQRTPRGQPIMRNVLANLMSKLEQQG